ncbi:MAG TPA: tRNA epoxyqueuosine(34) reductase QueG [Limnobacter sp.]|uniref:tRNA epoxyqueuosine(34) reductase QueG n=1 Tax=Limnobacter sp. TaxID=2003368 RepID=UPI002ED99B1B
MSDLEQQHWALIQAAAQRQGLTALGVSDTNLQACEPHLTAWLNNGMHGEMAYMARHGTARLNPNLLLEGTIRIVSLRIPYVPNNTLTAHGDSDFTDQTLQAVHDPSHPYISLYARGRDYHKVIRKALQRFMTDVHAQVGHLGYRVAVDSAPTPEVEIARKAGLGWRGKHTLLIHPKEGSLFFLGEVFTNLPLPLTGEYTDEHCGTCTRCMTACPTQAIVAPYSVDARRCISYLTIEHDSAIPLALRPAMGTRIYGCDDCQLVCPWNKFSKPTVFADFEARPMFAKADWAELMGWTEQEFLQHTEGTAIRRIGYRRFRRNLAVAAGNAQGVAGIPELLRRMRDGADDFLKEHIDWALAQH